MCVHETPELQSSDLIEQEFADLITISPRLQFCFQSRHPCSTVIHLQNRSQDMHDPVKLYPPVHPSSLPTFLNWFLSLIHNHPQSSTLIICWIQRRSSGLDSCWEKSLWQLKYPDHDRYHQQAVWDHFMASSTWFQRVLLNLNCRSFSQILSERFF